MIDPIRFKPYDPSTDNRALATPDMLPGFDANTQRVSNDMQNYFKQQRENDRIREGSSDLRKRSSSSRWSL